MTAFVATVLISVPSVPKFPRNFYQYRGGVGVVLYDGSRPYSLGYLRSKLSGSAIVQKEISLSRKRHLAKGRF